MFGIVLGIIIIVIMPVVAVIALFNGDINIDTARLQQIVVEEMSDEEKAKLQAVEDTMKAIETAMTEKGFTAERTKEAQVLYTLALYDHSKADGFVDKLVGCFAEDQTDEQLIAAVNAAFGTELKSEDYSKIMNSIRANSINTSGFTDPHSKNNLDLVEWAKQAQSHGWGKAESRTWQYGRHRRAAEPRGQRNTPVHRQNGRHHTAERTDHTKGVRQFRRHLRHRRHGAEI